MLIFEGEIARVDKSIQNSRTTNDFARSHSAFGLDDHPACDDALLLVPTLQSATAGLDPVRRVGKLLLVLH